MSWETAPHLFNLPDFIPYTFEAHGFAKAKFGPWAVCKWCGLVNFRNRLTKKAIELGCNNRFHPQWKSYVKQLSKP